jgi:predicted Fe-Mo cluster-binding NifX family protein
MAAGPAEKFGRAEYFALISVNRDERRVEEMSIVPNPERTREARAGLHVVRDLVQEKIDALITKDIGEIAFHALRDHLVSVYRLEGDRLDDILDNFLNERLTMIQEPTKVENE